MAYDIFSGEWNQQDFSCGIDDAPEPEAPGPPGPRPGRWSPKQARALAKATDTEIKTNAALTLKKVLEKSAPMSLKDGFAGLYKNWQAQKGKAARDPEMCQKFRTANAGWTKKISSLSGDGEGEKKAKKSKWPLVAGAVALFGGGFLLGRR